VLLHHQVGVPTGSESFEPAGEQRVERRLADANRGIGVDGVETDVGGQAGLDGCVRVACNDGVDRRGSGGRRVGYAQAHRPLVHVDGPDGGLGGPSGQGDGDGAVAAPEVEQVGGPLRRRRPVEQQVLRTGIDSVAGEHAGVGRELDGEVGQRQAYLSWTGRHLGLRLEVLPGGRAIHSPDATLAGMAPYTIRVFGDPVLKQRATEVGDIDGALVRLAEDMLTTMYDAPGLGLAAPQVGVQKRLFVYDLDDQPQVLVNPVISESRGEWSYFEGCLSVPGQNWEILRPKEIFLTGYDLDGNEVQIEADELEARLFQHELDHLDGILLLDHLDDDQRKLAKKALRELVLEAIPEPEPQAARRRLSLRK